MADIIIHVPPPSSSAQHGTSRMSPSSRDLTTMASSTRRSVGEGEQLAISCFMSAITKPSKWAMARNSSIIVQRIAKYSLHQEGDGFIMSVGTSNKHCKMCCTSFNIECKEVIEASHTREVIYEAFYTSLQYHS